MRAKGLSYADVERPDRLAGQPRQGNGDIEPDRPEAGIIAQAKTDAITQVLLEIGECGCIGLTRVDEGNHADLVGDFYARFKRGFKQAQPARGLSVEPERAKRTPSIAAHRSAAAGEKSPVIRNIEKSRAAARAEADPAGDDVAAFSSME